MRKFWLGFFLLLISFLLMVRFSLAQAPTEEPPTDPNAPQFATCDLCGYCRGGEGQPEKIPGNWKACRDCIYPEAEGEAGSLNTLRIKINSSDPEAQDGQAPT